MFDRLASPGGSLTFRGSGLQLNQPQHPFSRLPQGPSLSRLGFRRAFGLKLGRESSNELV